MQKRIVGRTGIEVSEIGLGTVKFGRNQGVKYPQAFELPSDQVLSALLSTAADLGINLLDTAPAYGTSEERLGQLLKGQRERWVISTKVGETFARGESTFDFSADAIKQSIERSLQRLQTDYLDIVLVHSNGDDEKIIQEDEVFVTLSALKERGLIRAYGMSTKTLAGGFLAVEQSDVVMVSFSPDYQAEKAVLTQAEQYHTGILIKKALGSGHLTMPASEAIRFVLAESSVASVIVGTINPQHLKENVTGAFV